MSDEKFLQAEKYKEFCQYFNELESNDIPFGITDLIRKAKDLDLPLLSIPELQELKKNAD